MEQTVKTDPDLSGERQPRVKWSHIDGPMMTRCDGTIKWLSYRERLMYWLGMWSLEQIEARR